jgi:hypothetical protein
MTWLGHHEFGADQRAFAFPGWPDAGEDRGGVEYWLKAWIAVYAALLDQPEGVRGCQTFVDYDALCAGGPSPRLLSHTGVQAIPAELVAPPARAGESADPALLARAMDLHAHLVARAAL